MEASRHVGDVELTPNPTVAPNVIRMDDMAADANPPAMIGDHCSDQGPSVRAGADVSIGDSIVMAGYRRPKNERMAITMTTSPTK
jgi:hypothetical protein